MDQCPYCGIVLPPTGDAFCPECRQGLDLPANERLSKREPAATAEPRSSVPPTERAVGLIRCPTCGRQISTEAEACPQCGHPNRGASSVSTGPRCYACSAPATTKCQSCGALSCVQHLQSIYVPHGRGGAYELRCESCYSSAATWKVIGWVFGGIVLVIVAIFFFGVFLPNWNRVQEKNNQFQKDFDREPVE
jgi:hypothetical protein